MTNCLMSALFTSINFRRIRRFFLIGVSLWLAFDVALAVIVFVYGLTDRAQPADVIIVLGAGLKPDLSASDALARRAERGAELWKQQSAPVIICAGGYTQYYSRSEAEGCAAGLRQNGVPQDRVILEEFSRSTEENAVYSRDIMVKHGWKTALVVSDGYHLLRTTWIFSQIGLIFSTSPAAPPPLGELLLALAREVVALHWQLFKTLFGLPYSYVPWV
jgi:uncharacterized SAM-binding protein YcdF (DUF218 family)